MLHEMTIKLANSFDDEYGKWDIAPRVMGLSDYDGETGYLLAYDPKVKTYLIAWDSDYPHEQRAKWISGADFRVLSGLVA